MILVARTGGWGWRWPCGYLDLRLISGMVVWSTLVVLAAGLVLSLLV